MKTSTHLPTLGTLIALVALSLSACSEPSPLATADEEQDLNSEQVLSAKPNCQDDPSHPSCSDSGSSGDTPMYANLKPSGDPSTVNELVDPDGVGANLSTTKWVDVFDRFWDGTQWVDGVPAIAPDCPADRDFKNLRGEMDGQQVTWVVLSGNAGKKVSWSSDRIDVTPQTPDETGWTFQVRRYIPVFEGNGKSKHEICTVYVHDIEFTPVN